LHFRLRPETAACAYNAKRNNSRTAAFAFGKPALFYRSNAAHGFSAFKAEWIGIF